MQKRAITKYMSFLWGGEKMKVILYVNEYEFRKYDFGNNIINSIGKKYTIEQQIISTGQWVATYDPQTGFSSIGNCPNLRVIYNNVGKQAVNLIKKTFDNWIQKNNLSKKQQYAIITT